MSGAAAAVVLALGSVGSGLLALCAWALTSAARGTRDARGAAVAVGITGAVLAADPVLAVPLIGALLGFALGLAAGLGCLRMERHVWLGSLILIGCVAVLLLGQPGPSHGGGVQALAETWLRAPGTPLAIAAGVLVILGRRAPALALAGLLLLGLGLWSEGRPRIAEAGATAALLAGAAAAWLPPARLRVVGALVAVQLLAAGLGWIPVLDPYDHPAELPRRAAAVLDVRVGGASLVSGLAVGPDGHVYYGEMATGVVRELDPDVRGEGRILARVPLPEIRGTRGSYELGLWGLAVDPAGDWLYAMAVHRWDEDDPDPDARSSHIVRVSLAGPDRGRLEEVMAGLPAGPIHSGGVLSFGPDGQLYATVGDGLRFGARGDRDAGLATGPSSAVGAVLRLTAAGAPSDGNPVPGSPVHAWGFRNPYGLAFGADGSLFVTENGGDCCDRLFRVQRGRHHGWPPGPTGADRVPPLWDSGRHRPGPTGLAILGEPYGDSAGDLLFATWHTGGLHRVRLVGDTVIEHEIVLDVPPAHPDPDTRYRFAGAFTALATAPDGVVWFASVNAVGRIIAITPR